MTELGGRRRSVTQPLSLLGLMDLHRRSLALALGLGVLLGCGIAYLSPVTYTAQGQMIAGATSVDAAAVPSFTQAGQSLAETYSRVFSGDRVQARMRASGFDPRTATATASPVAGTSVILVETTAPTPEAAVKAANVGIDALSTTVAGLLNNSSAVEATRASLRVAYEQVAQATADRNALDKRRVAAGSQEYEDVAADLGSAQSSVESIKQLLTNQILDSSASNGVQRLTSASVVSSSSAQRYQFWGAIGLIAGAAVWLIVAFLRSPNRRRGLKASTRR